MSKLETVRSLPSAPGVPPASLVQTVARLQHQVASLPQQMTDLQTQQLDQLAARLLPIAESLDNLARDGVQAAEALRQATREATGAAAQLKDALAQQARARRPPRPAPLWRQAREWQRAAMVAVLAVPLSALLSWALLR